MPALQGFAWGAAAALAASALWITWAGVQLGAERRAMSAQNAAFEQRASLLVEQAVGDDGVEGNAPRTAPISGAVPISGPFTVIDGDTFDDAAGVRYRLAGVDAPGIHGRDFHCVAERELGLRARDFLEAILKDAPHVTAAVVEVQPARDGYRERRIAQVNVGGRDVGVALVEAGLGRWSDTRFGWCNG